jgi:hypothetical protein
MRKLLVDGLVCTVDDTNIPRLIRDEFGIFLRYNDGTLVKYHQLYPRGVKHTDAGTFECYSITRLDSIKTKGD